MKKKKRKTDEVNYWESMADSLIGLLFLIILIVLLLILYIIRYNNNQHTDDKLGDTYYNDHDDDWDGVTVTTWNDHAGWGGVTTITTTYYEHHYDGGGGDGDDDYPDPDPGKDGDGMDKAAVYVQVIDGETERTIKEKGIQFELYTYNNILQILNTYYPKKIEYKKFETDEFGVFYLPEKINLYTYYFKNLTKIDGYDKAENVEFRIEESYDWPDPFVVTIPMYPSKNIIKVQLKDADTLNNLTGSTFDVAAAEDIRTKDETLRYSKGDIVDTIKLDENGYGESKELFLGKYTLKQHIIPTYYAKTDDLDVTVADKSKGNAPVHEIPDPKTRVNITVKDALYDTTMIENAEFSLSKGDNVFVGNYKTDDTGKFVITDLDKNTTYYLRQTKAPSLYNIDSEVYEFKVDNNGFIDDKVIYDIEIDNVITRLSFGVCDFLLRGQISDVNMALYDSTDNVVKVWDSTGLEQIIEGLDEGNYILVMSGKKSKGQKLTVEQVADMQIHTYYLWTTTDTIIVIVLSIIFIAFIIFLCKYIKKRKEKKDNDRKGKVST